MSKYEDRIEKAVTIAFLYGMTDGAHHKQWVIDQMVRALLGDIGYKNSIHKFVDDEWDKGVAP